VVQLFVNQKGRIGIGPAIAANHPIRYGQRPAQYWAHTAASQVVIQNRNSCEPRGLTEHRNTHTGALRLGILIVVHGIALNGASEIVPLPPVHFGPGPQRMNSSIPAWIPAWAWLLFFTTFREISMW
jgi:hypothetical protein